MSEKKQDDKSEKTIPRYGKYEVEKCQNKFKSLILDNMKTNFISNKLPFT